MSAWLVSCTHIRVLVTAAITTDRYDSISAPPRGMLERYPSAFGALLRDLDNGKLLKWHAMNPSAFGRALWVANCDSLEARYPGSGKPGDEQMYDLGEVLAYEHAMDERDLFTVIKAANCFNYQACEVESYDASWAALVMRELCDNVIRTSAPYDAAPWGIDDPEGGPLQAGATGAPVSLLSLVNGGR